MAPTPRSFTGLVANALEAATGVRLKDLPLTPEKVLAELAKL